MIKLVIWDLDETFWEGTLSEEGIKNASKNIELVKKLTKIGVVNSISSKNDFNQAKEKLEELGIWDYFVFPHIGWYSKGNAVKSIIEKMALRANDVTFIDDNHLNLKEVKALSPKITAIHPDQISEYFSWVHDKNMVTKSSDRLKKYKILEKKTVIRNEFETDEEFLKSCNIKVFIKQSSIDDSERIHELVQRTNQLNFTKRRDPLNDILSLISSNEHECHSIYVSDDYGEYGLVGFVCLDLMKNSLDHFCFSCRTINLGVEQFIYNYFKRPGLMIIGDTVSSLDELSLPDWIGIGTNTGLKHVVSGSSKVLFKGGCDLLQMTFYLKNSSNIVEETNSIIDGVPVHSEHTNILLSKIYKKEYLPFLTKEATKSEMFTSDFDTIIYSALMDYTQDIYKEQSDSYGIPIGAYGIKPRWNNLNDAQSYSIESFFMGK